MISTTVPTTFLDPIADQVHRRDHHRHRPRDGVGVGEVGPKFTHSQAVIGLGDVVESRDSGFILGLQTEVPIVDHKLQDNSNLG